MTSPACSRAAARLEELHEISGTPKRAFTAEARSDLALLAQVSSTLRLNNTQPSSIAAAHAQDCLQIADCRIQQVGPLWPYSPSCLAGALHAPAAAAPPCQAAASPARAHPHALPPARSWPPGGRSGRCGSRSS